LRPAWRTLFPRWFARRARPSPDEVGRLGEELAARHLQRRGWRILHRRLKTRFGEVDLVARDGPQTVCVEVKTARLESLERTLEPLLRPARRYDHVRHARQTRAARSLARGARVDLLEVLIEGPTGCSRILHHRDVRGPVMRVTGMKRSC